MPAGRLWYTRDGSGITRNRFLLWLHFVLKERIERAQISAARVLRKDELKKLRDGAGNNDSNEPIYEHR
jgi:hypothetical protein